MIDTINAIIRAETIDDVVRGTLDTIRKEFGWAYASYWTVDPAEHALVFSLESGRVDDEFQRLTRTARFREGEGLNGRAWRHRDLVHVDDLSELHDCCRAPLARRAGIKTAIALPIIRDGQVIGTLDFFAIDAVEVSPTRLDALRTIGQLASDKISKLGKQVDLTRIKQMVENAPVNLMYADLDLQDPVHEPAGREDAQAAGGPSADQGRSDDRPVDRHLPQAARTSAAAAGRSAEPAADSDDQRRPRAFRALGQRDARSATADTSAR